MRVTEDVAVSMDNASPTAAPSDPISGGTTNTRNDSFGEQPNWMPIDSHQNGESVQRTLQGLVIGQDARTTYGSENMNSAGYGNGGSSNGADTGLSPDTAQSASNRPTPNSTTPSDTRPNLQAGQTNSGGTSYETSPASSHQNRIPPTDGRSMSSFFPGQPDYSSIPATGMTPDNNAFSMPETPGRGFDVPSGWEMNNQMNGQTTGLTPVGEGVFRHLLGLGPMDPM